MPPCTPRSSRHVKCDTGKSENFPNFVKVSKATYFAKILPYQNLKLLLHVWLNVCTMSLLNSSPSSLQKGKEAVVKVCSLAKETGCKDSK